MHYFQLTAHELLDSLKNQKLSSEDIWTSVAERSKAVNEKTNVFLRYFDRPGASSGSGMPIPIGIKDNLSIQGKEVTCASRILVGYVAPFDAHVIERVKASGGRMIGYVNMDEFAFGSSTETSSYGPTRNPWDLTRVPGGSSGGSAAAVAAGQAVWTLGSDTGGSIRQPAAFCGIVGLKPTYGRVSRYGLIAFASSLDQIGPLTKDVTDAALLLNIIAGYDDRDSTCMKFPVPDYTKALTGDIKGLTIGLPKEYFIDGIAPGVKAAIDEAIAVFKAKGAAFKEISLPHTEYAVGTYYIVATAEASSNLARFDGIQYGARRLPGNTRKATVVDLYEETRGQGFGTESKRRIMLGTYALSSGYYDAYYLRAQKVRTLIKQDFDRAFTGVDIILTPTAPTTAFRIGEKSSDPISMYLSDIFTIPANLAGIPAISVPCGFDEQGMPVGLQLMAKPFAEEQLLNAAFTYEQAAGWHKERAKL